MSFRIPSPPTKVDNSIWKALTELDNAKFRKSNLKLHYTSETQWCPFIKSHWWHVRCILLAMWLDGFVEVHWFRVPSSLPDVDIHLPFTIDLKSNIFRLPDAFFWIFNYLCMFVEKLYNGIWVPNLCILCKWIIIYLYILLQKHLVKRNCDKLLKIYSACFQYLVWRRILKHPWLGGFQWSYYYNLGDTPGMCF